MIFYLHLENNMSSVTLGQISKFKCFAMHFWDVIKCLSVEKYFIKKKAILLKFLNFNQKKEY